MSNFFGFSSRGLLVAACAISAGCGSSDAAGTDPRTSIGEQGTAPGVSDGARAGAESGGPSETDAPGPSAAPIPSAANAAPAPRAWTVEPIVAKGPAVSPSLVLDAQGGVHVAYVFESGLNEARYATRTGPGQWATQLVAAATRQNSSLFVGTGLALDASGTPHVAHYDDTTLQYDVAMPDGTWKHETADPTVGSANRAHVGVLFTPSGEPVVAYPREGVGPRSGGIALARRSAGVWKTEIVDPGEALGNGDHVVGTGVGSLMLDSKGRPHLCYRQDRTIGLRLFTDLKYASWDGATWNVQMIEAGGQTGDSCSLLLDAHDRPQISYWDWGAGGLKLATTDGTGAWKVSSIDPVKDSGRSSVMRRGADGRLRVVYSTGDRHLELATQRDDGGWAIEHVEHATVQLGYEPLGFVLDAQDHAHVVAVKMDDEGMGLLYLHE